MPTDEQIYRATQRFFRDVLLSHGNLITPEIYELEENGYFEEEGSDKKFQEWQGIVIRSLTRPDALKRGNITYWKNMRKKLSHDRSEFIHKALIEIHGEYD